MRIHLVVETVVGGGDQTADRAGGLANSLFNPEPTENPALG
ncbi:MAG: hypothetical protein ACRDYX_22795 [Egibacteraceae bacterium]